MRLKLALILSLYNFFVFSDDHKIRVYTFEISKINNEKQKSVYSEFIKYISKKSITDFEIRYLPPARAIENFMKDKESCIFPFTKTSDLRDEKILLSKPIGEIELFAINLKGRELITKENFSKFKKIGMKSIYQNKISKLVDKEIYFLENDDQLFHMLGNKRIDLILESVPDIYLQFPSVDRFSQEYQFDKNFKAQVFEDFFACHLNTEKQRKLIEMINILMNN